MDVNTTASAAAAKNYEASKTGNTGKTGKHEAAHHHPSYAPEKDSKEASITPKDIVEFSDAAEAVDEKVKGKHDKDNWKNFDMDAFQSSIRNTLMASIQESKKALMDAGVEFAKADSNSILYDLSGLKEGDKTKAADVPEYWNAENTSQRIVDFAMSFRGMSDLSDEDYIKQMREAVQEGYRLAKKAIGDLPGGSAKLFNDTYSLTMKKFDDILAEMQGKKEG